MGVAYNSRIVIDGLVLALDAGNTKSYPGSGTTWTDLSGNGNTGTLVNGVGYNSGNLGSLVFDGSNDYLTIPVSSNFDFGTGNFTVECWVYPTSVSSSPNIYSQRGNANGITFRISSGSKLQFFYGEGSGGITGLTNVSLNAWSHVALTRSSSQITLWLNGSSDASVANSVNLNSTINPTIGRSNSFGEYFSGRIPIVRVYKGKGLTAAEVTQNFNALRGRFGI